LLKDVWIFTPVTTSNSKTHIRLDVTLVVSIRGSILVTVLYTMLTSTRKETANSSKTIHNL